MPRGYQIVDPGLELTTLACDYDAQVRCLSYLMRHIEDVVEVPSGVLFELIYAQYIGGPWPAIGLYTETFVDTDSNLCRLSMKIGDELEALVARVGVDEVLALSSGETICWFDVLDQP